MAQVFAQMLKPANSSVTLYSSTTCKPRDGIPLCPLSGAAQKDICLTGGVWRRPSEEEIKPRLVFFSLAVLEAQCPPGSCVPSVSDFPFLDLQAGGRARGEDVLLGQSHPGPHTGGGMLEAEG